jgi:glycosyltransferase involved in cell wall biosynthesis
VAAAPNPSRWKHGRKYLVGYLGTIGPQEGLHYLVEAAEYLKKQRPQNDIGWVVIGDGPTRRDVMELAKRKGLEHDIAFPGRLDDATMIEALCTCDVCLNTDLATEMNDKSTMNKIIEYMALGRPIVQFDLTEGRVSAGLASAYARPNDAVELAEKTRELLENPTLRRQMGEYGRSRVEEKLAWRYSVPILLDAYETLFGHAVVRRAKELDAEHVTAKRDPAEQAATDGDGPKLAGSVVA